MKAKIDKILKDYGVDWKLEKHDGSMEYYEGLLYELNELIKRE